MVKTFNRKLRLTQSYIKYKKNKLGLNEIASAMQSFYFLVKFGLVRIYKYIKGLL